MTNKNPKESKTTENFVKKEIEKYNGEEGLIIKITCKDFNQRLKIENTLKKIIPESIKELSFKEYVMEGKEETSGMVFLKNKEEKMNKGKIFDKLLVDLSFIGFHRDLDKALGLFLEENLTSENNKTMNDFSIMDFCEWVSNKKKESESTKEEKTNDK